CWCPVHTNGFRLPRTRRWCRCRSGRSSAHSTRSARSPMSCPNYSATTNRHWPGWTRPGRVAPQRSGRGTLRPWNTEYWYETTSGFAHDDRASRTEPHLCPVDLPEQPSAPGWIGIGAGSADERSGTVGTRLPIRYGYEDRNAVPDHEHRRGVREGSVDRLAAHDGSPVALAVDSRRRRAHRSHRDLRLVDRARAVVVVTHARAAQEQGRYRRFAAATVVAAQCLNSGTAPGVCEFAVRSAHPTPV